MSQQRIIDDALEIQAAVDEAVRRALETLQFKRNVAMLLGKDYYSVNILVSVADQNPAHMGTLDDVNLTSTYTFFIEKKKEKVEESTT